MRPNTTDGPAGPAPILEEDDMEAWKELAKRPWEDLEAAERLMRTCYWPGCNNRLGPTQRYYCSRSCQVCGQSRDRAIRARAEKRRRG